METYQPISTGETWTPGETYRLKFEIDHIKLFGITLPDELVPDYVKDQLAIKQIDQTVTKLQDDPRLRVQSYEYAGREFTITVQAVQHASPVFVIVGAIIALAILFGISLVMREAAKLVKAGKELVDAIGPLGTNLGIITIAAIVLIGGYFYVRSTA